MFATNSWFRYDPGKDILSLFLYVQPGARRNAFVGLHGGRLKLQVSAPATDNKANERVVDLLREQFNLPAAKVRISHGRNSRSKTVAILGPGSDGLARLATLAAP
ncbi:MAG: DUF167 domain-containing protein [Burkholderiales bacterium]